MIKVNGVTVTPTIFPDKTSQVWKLPLDDINMSLKYSYYVYWEFENEAEFMHLAQLVHLLTVADPFRPIDLYMPYLPYARQDKAISNNATFALNTFLVLLDTLDLDSIKVFDAHNSKMLLDILQVAENIRPDKEINSAIRETKATTILYPDKGAYTRYNDLVRSDCCVVVAEKVRDQSTGEIVKTELTAPVYKTDRVLIVDDLCDGGATFIKLMPLIKQASEVSLYVSHGIFSKGVQVLKDAGIARIFTKNGEVK